MNTAQKEIAVKNGCTPIFLAYYQEWCCNCDDGLHCGDQQCSIISEKSAQKVRKRVRPKRAVDNLLRGIEFNNPTLRRFQLPPDLPPNSSN